MESTNAAASWRVRLKKRFSSERKAAVADHDARRSSGSAPAEVAGAGQFRQRAVHPEPRQSLPTPARTFSEMCICAQDRAASSQIEPITRGVSNADRYIELAAEGATDLPDADPAPYGT